MNRPEIERLIKQYRTDPSIIFQMPAVIKKTLCGSAVCIGGQVCVNHGWELREDGNAIKDGETVSALMTAGKILDLSYQQSIALFLKAKWPAQFRHLPDTPALAADRLQHFLGTDGAE